MNKKQELPAFKSEAEEAQWWYDNREARGEEFAQAIREGRTSRNTLADRIAAASATIRLDPEDIATARAIAERRGMEVTTYLKQLVHEALEREDKTAA
ncbi:hypothetical protein FTO74_18245 [Granulicella sp. WH15]|uniref:hypothetical protein n=1 Tax=Granulicella sp. WH15 TaxID=2602070 RepID=UPI001366F2BF|nr:hypothetical protein [Granulicella sp. WH15]QHN05075.1 hypothetical protein FTO74_18245 [Granulicella sp. WH15]